MVKTSKENQQLLEFMPEELALLEQPVSPLGRSTIWLLFLLLASLMLYSFFGKIDIVASGRGAIKPSGNSQLVQMPKTGLINALEVEEGQVVKKGDLLFSVKDPTLGLDTESSSDKVKRAEIEKKALTALIKNEPLEKHVKPEEIAKEPAIKTYYDSVLASQSASPKLFANEKEQLQGNLDILATEVETIKSSMKEADKQLNLLKDKQALKNARSEILRIEAQVERLEEEEETFRQAIGDNNGSRRLWENKVTEREAMETQLVNREAALEEQLIELSSQSTSLSTEIEKLTSQLKAKNKSIEIGKKQIDEITLKMKDNKTNQKEELSKLLLEKEKELKDYESQAKKGEELLRGEKVVAPVEGTVTELTSEELGLTLQQSQKVMSIVPKGAALYVEAYMRNQDIGFIGLEQEVSLKVDSFSFQKYGLLKGKVIHISPTAIFKEEMGNVYKVKLSINQKQLAFKEDQGVLTPGMEVTAEIQTGKRRIIDFFLEPLVKYLDESLKLR